MVKKAYGRLIPSWLNEGFIGLLDPIVSAAARLRVHPNTLTTITFLLGCAATVAVMSGRLRPAAALLLLSGLCDVIDGKLARQIGKVSKFGALYDSTLDRYSEILFFFGSSYLFIRLGWNATAVATALAMGGSILVSYVRARAEGLGFDCKVGLIQRPERILLLGVSGLIHMAVFVPAIWILALLSNVTAVQRLLWVWQAEHNDETNKE